jgi:hypothetical protein
MNKTMMKKYQPVVLIAMIGLSLSFHSCTHTAKSGISISGDQSFADSAVSTVRLIKDAKGREVLQKNNTYYDLVSFIDREDVKKIMLKITKSETAYIDSGTTQSHFIVSGANIADKKAAWTKEFSGSDIDYSNKVVVVHSEGRNSNEEDTYTQYSLLTGEKLMTYTYAPLTVLIPNTSDWRFLGYLSQQSATDERPSDFASVSYVGSNQTIDRVAIKLKKKDAIPPYTPELQMFVARDSGNSIANEGKRVIMGRADRTFSAKDINNFALQINYQPVGGDKVVTILLPVREDRLDIDNATYDKTLFELSKDK